MTALFLIGDVRERQAQLIAAGEHFDFILCSPPFLALRSYLPPDHPDKDKEIGSEGTPAEFIDVLLELTAQWAQLLAPHGSIAIELGDTYAGSGGAGGDYDENGLREGQQRFTGSARRDRIPVPRNLTGGHGWPLDKSLACIPQLYQVALAYRINPLTGHESPAGRWRIRNLKPWIRSNPPVGALGDKERPATSYVVVACRARDRWFDLDAVRTVLQPGSEKPRSYRAGSKTDQEHGQATVNNNDGQMSNAAGAPPRDWWHHVDAILDAGLDELNKAGAPGKVDLFGVQLDSTEEKWTTRGTHLRRRLEHAGILTTLEALDISPKGYAGAHYAVWPPELVRQLVDEMCPRRVCTTCGLPSRRIVESEAIHANGEPVTIAKAIRRGVHVGSEAIGHDNSKWRRATTTGWSDCGHGTWRPGRILDPFVGSGTTLAVATGMGRDATGIDIDERNAHLAEQRVGMFLTVDYPNHEATA